MRARHAIRKRRRIVKRFILCTSVVLGLSVASMFRRPAEPEKTPPPGTIAESEAARAYYTAEDFGIETVYSAVDYNQNGVDDFTDILLGARKDAENMPEYNGDYCDTGYPPDNIGVCSDVVWRAFKYAGYSLRDMVDRDIQQRPQAYTKINMPDSNIDFRRVVNLRVFFDQHAVLLTTDVGAVDQWQPGDIVIFKNNRHIGIVSDRRNSVGIPYIIHNSGQPQREEDYLGSSDVTAHYRFDASVLASQQLLPWHES